jgi:hypothetical protein
MREHLRFRLSGENPHLKHGWHFATLLSRDSANLSLLATAPGLVLDAEALAFASGCFDVRRHSVSARSTIFSFGMPACASPRFRLASSGVDAG